MRTPGWWAYCPVTKQGPYRDRFPIREAWYQVYREVRAIRSERSKIHLQSPWIPEHLQAAANKAVDRNKE